MNNYWNGNGKYQEELDRLNALKPDRGMTENKYMDLFITVSNIYYDVYNNGGYNLKYSHVNEIEKYIKPFADDIKSLRLNVKMETLIKNFKKLDKLETLIDEVILYIRNKDLTYNKYTVFLDYSNEKLSETKKEGFSEITFGNYTDYKNWIECRTKNMDYKFVY